jgi:hypothetical protein
MRDTRVMPKKQVDTRQHTGQETHGQSAQDSSRRRTLSQEPFHHLIVRRALQQDRLHALGFESFKNSEQTRGLDTFMTTAAARVDERQRTLVCKPTPTQIGFCLHPESVGDRQDGWEDRSTLFSHNFETPLALMNALESRGEGRLHDGGRRTASLERRSEQSTVIIGPSHGQVTAAQPVSEIGIVRRFSRKQRGTGGRRHGKPSIDEMALAKHFRNLCVPAEQKIMIWIPFPEAANRGHCKQEVSKPTRMEDDDRADHAQDDGLAPRP